MKTTAFVAIVAGVAVGGCAGPDDPAPAGPMAYGMPSPEGATFYYELADTLAVAMDVPVGTVEATVATTASVGLAFQADSGGVRVTGTVESFAGTMTSPTMEPESGELGDVAGTLEVVVGGQGVEDLVSFPLVRGAMAQTSPFPLLAFLLFPRLPGGEVEAGATWVDTATVSGDTGEMTTLTRMVGTYTLAGTTVVDGRTLVRVEVAGETTIENDIGRGATMVEQELAGSSSGFFLWDPERGLVTHAEYEQELEGTATVPTMGSFGLSLAGPMRIRLE